MRRPTSTEFTERRRRKSFLLTPNAGIPPVDPTDLLRALVAFASTHRDEERPLAIRQELNLNPRSRQDLNYSAAVWNRVVGLIHAYQNGTLKPWMLRDATAKPQGFDLAVFHAAAVAPLADAAWFDDATLARHIAATTAEQRATMRQRIDTETALVG